MGHGSTTSPLHHSAAFSIVRLPLGPAANGATAARRRRYNPVEFREAWPLHC